MKYFPSAVCGLLLVLPLTAGSAFAQSSAAQSGTTSSGKSQSMPSAPTSTAPSPNHGITSLTPGAPTPPAHPITMEQTRELLTLMGYKKIEENNWSQMIAMNKQAAPFIPEDVWTDVQGSIAGIDYPTLMQPIYAKYLSQEDATKALAFYHTPEGHRVLQSMPPILGESVAASQQKGRQIGREAIERHRPEIEAAQKKYQAEHPPQGGGMGPGGPGGVNGSSPGAAPGASGPGAASPSTSPSTPPSGTTSKPQR